MVVSFLLPPLPCSPPCLVPTHVIVCTVPGLAEPTGNQPEASGWGRRWDSDILFWGRKPWTGVTETWNHTGRVKITWHGWLECDLQNSLVPHFAFFCSRLFQFWFCLCTGLTFARSALIWYLFFGYLVNKLKWLTEIFKPQSWRNVGDGGVNLGARPLPAEVRY